MLAKNKKRAVFLVAIASIIAMIVAVFTLSGERTAAKAEEVPQIYWGIKAIQVSSESSGNMFTGYELVLGNSETDITSEDDIKMSGSMNYNHNCSGSNYYVPWLSDGNNNYNQEAVPDEYKYNFYSVNIKSEIATTDMGNWFYGFNIKTVDLSKVDMTQTRSFMYLFASSDIESFSFTGLRVPTSDDPHFQVSMDSMFSNCHELVTVDLSALTYHNGWPFLGNEKLQKIVAPQFHPDSYADIDLPKEWDMQTNDYTKEWWNGKELTNKITKADAGKTFTRHAQCTEFDHVQASAATCTQDGATEHWACKVCDKVYADSDGLTQITESVVLPKTGHSYGDWIDEVAATKTQNGTKGHYTCGNCGKYFDDSHNEISDLTIPATGNSGGNKPSGDKTAPADKEGLTGGAIAGIVVGCVVFVLIVLYVIGLVLYKKGVISWGFCGKLYFFIKK